MATSSQALETKSLHTQSHPNYKIYPSSCENFIFITYWRSSRKKDVYDAFFSAFEISDLHTCKLLATWVEENEPYKEEDAYVLNDSICYKSSCGKHVRLRLDKTQGVFVKTMSEFRFLPEVSVVRGFTSPIPYVGAAAGIQCKLSLANLSIGNVIVPIPLKEFPKLPNQLNSQKEYDELFEEFRLRRILFAIFDFHQNIILGSDTSGLIKMLKQERDGCEASYSEDKTMTHEASFLKTLNFAYVNVTEPALRALPLPNGSILLVYLFKENTADTNYLLGAIHYDISYRKRVSQVRINTSMTPADFSDLEFNVTSDGRYLYFNYLEHSFVELETGQLTTLPRMVLTSASSCLLFNGLLVDYSADAFVVKRTPPYNDFLEVKKIEDSLPAITPLPPVLGRIVRSYLDARETLFSRPRLLKDKKEEAVTGLSINANSG